jgi:hypothetical protein
LPNVTNATLSSCAGTNGNGTYNLTTANVSSDPGVTVTYFTNSNLTGQIANPANYSGPAELFMQILLLRMDVPDRHRLL